MNHQKSFFFLTARSFALNQSPACATSIKVGTSVMKVETFIDSKATWTHQGCTAASMGISFDLPHSSPAAHFTTAKAGGKCHMKAISVGSKKITLFAALSCCHFPSNFLCILSARSATDARSATQVFWKRRQLSGSWLVLVTWDYQEQCEVILRNAATVTEGFPAHFPRSHSRTRG